ncbi:hypothetical protein [Hathewaya limosa]|uniref:Uncharacterized protein n=1 Tax=Hathewaya limosa TaxID=1536 RepID=A0ABU0JQU4_HATLI|nr:hypothetical protein [Hathewaya limosa]MDQ0479466.1 hypothetical protein [Hathewaya limosa]
MKKTKPLELQQIQNQYIFVPAKNSFISNTQAQAYGVVGCDGNIGYVLESLYKTPTSFNIQITPLPFSYKLYINGIFVQEVQANTKYNNTPEVLTNVVQSVPININLFFNIPSWYTITQDSVTFLISANPVGVKDIISINSTLILGKVSLTSSYDISEYSVNPKLFSIQYEINLSISQGIKLYDVQLDAFYPPSCIFVNAAENNNLVNVTNESGEVIYPLQNEIDATSEKVNIQYTYNLLQYKNTPLSIGALEQNHAILSLRTVLNIENKSIFETSTLQNSNQEKLTCAYVDKVFGKCTQYLCYPNIPIPVVNGYNFKNIKFETPVIVEDSLTIEPSTCQDNFSEIKYTFQIPYTIIYTQTKCTEVNTTILTGTLPQKSISIILYTPKNEGSNYNVVLQSELENMNYNSNTSEATACIGVTTLSIGKVMTLINNLGKCDFVYCCPNCSN